MQSMIVTIDGPAGAGKSTVAKKLAERLGFRFLDTGAMYRTVALAAHRRGHDWQDGAGLVEIARQIRIEFAGERVLLDGQDVSQAIRTPEITAVTRYAADNPAVREILVAQQKQTAAAGNFVTEGRDQGTVVFPQAGCKIFLVASPRERALRRQEDLAKAGQHVSLEDILAQQNERDARDSSRAVGPLLAAADAVEVDTDGLSAEQVLDRLEQLVRERL